MSERYGILVERLGCDLREALPPHVLAQLVLYIAASELLTEDLQQQDAGRLRLATLNVAMSALGLTDASIERQKVQLRSGQDAPTLDRRN